MRTNQPVLTHYFCCTHCGHGAHYQNGYVQTEIKQCFQCGRMAARAVLAKHKP